MGNTASARKPENNLSDGERMTGKRKRTYCGECEHYRSFLDVAWCNTEPKKVRTYYEERMYDVLCKDRNKNNDCKYWKKKVKPEKLVHKNINPTTPCKVEDETSYWSKKNWWHPW